LPASFHAKPTFFVSVFRAAQFFHAVREGIFRQVFTVSTIRSAVLAGSLRKSLRVDFFHSMRKAITLQPFFQFRVGDRFLVAPFGNHGQIVQVFQQLFVVFNRKNGGGLSPFFICQKLDGRAHV
jgi:hypothetical protein